MKDPAPLSVTLTSPYPMDAELEGFPLKVLEVRCRDEHHPIFVRSTVLCSMESLRELRLFFLQAVAPTPPSFVLPVSHLQSIACDLGDILGMPIGPVPILQWWISNFQAQNNQVEKITIRVYLNIASGELKEKSAPQWRELDRVLLTKAPKLRKVQVILTLHNEGYGDLMTETQLVVMDNLKGIRKMHVELEFRMVLQSETDHAE
ncbi:uncharacterized protein EV420DRAFT_630782 [Desarmillaria tabescens]|uniref:Uncharacterized protein n=1 Tax=Armillaria tabescens TaxID=1929756 RepID=A0AA39N0F8_ARMTA|nr:uncharacterized protein EV420DRAFT_630782 [Desarmillaria tabescens]KAK0452913.1 hypothetical protein EV420DRAFT_630782 [Desarmillaria tabescens]